MFSLDYIEFCVTIYKVRPKQYAIWALEIFKLFSEGLEVCLTMSMIFMH